MVGWIFQERINSLGTQTSAADSPSAVSPSSPWLGSSAETQTVDEDAVLKPFNLCNMHTQTPWNEMDDQDSTELTHTETQTLLSSFLIDTLPECNSSNSNRKELLIKQSSEDAGTDPMENFIWWQSILFREACDNTPLWSLLIRGKKIRISLTKWTEKGFLWILMDILKGILYGILVHCTIKILKGFLRILIDHTKFFLELRIPRDWYVLIKRL